MGPGRKDPNEVENAARPEPLPVETPQNTSDGPQTKLQPPLSQGLSGNLATQSPPGASLADFSLMCPTPVSFHQQAPVLCL